MNIEKLREVFEPDYELGLLYRKTKHSNNEITNLRLASRKEQSHNMTLSTSNTSGVKGVSYCRLSGMYRAELRLDSKRVFDRKFKSIDEARLALEIARLEFHGDFNNNGVKL
jgi:hypothetical protein